MTGLVRNGVALCCALLIVAGFGSLVSQPRVTLQPGVDLSTASLAEVQKLTNRTVMDFGSNADGTVFYSYLADPVPEKLVEDEVLELRTENSFTKFEGVEGTGDNQKIILTSTFYSQPAFAQDIDGTWRILEYATTSRQAFRDRDMTLWKALTELLVRTAYADSISPFSGAGDGYAADTEADPATLNSCKGGSGTEAYAVATASEASSTNHTASPSTCTIIRGFIPFDTSAIPSNSTVSAATLDVYVTTKLDQDNDANAYIRLVTTSQVDSATLAASDYPNVGSTGMASDLDITTMTTSAYNTFTLTTFSAIKFSGQASLCGATPGVSCFGLREGHDILGSGLTTDTTNSIVFSTSEETGNTQDPYLSVTYTMSVSAVVSGMKVGAGGSLKVTGGGIKIR